MQTDREIFKAAVVQLTPAFFDNQATLNKIEKELTGLGAEQCQLVVLPESLIPGYPRGLNFGASVGRRTEEGRSLWLRYFENSIARDGEVSRRLAEMAGDLRLDLIIGVTERDQLNSTLYCSSFHYSEGALVHVHRKIKPTGTERVIWGEGDGSCIQSVATPAGRVGTLICWENYIPEARMQLYSSGVDVYVAPTADARDSWTASMRHIACESRTYVLSSNQYFTRNDYPPELREKLEPDQPDILCRGGSCIVSPYGEVLAGPLYDREGSLVVEIDHREIIRSRMDFDVIGHYRPLAIQRGR